MRTNHREAEVAERGEKRERKELPEMMNQLTGAVIGAAIEVHRVLGPGFLESVYQQAMYVELGRRGIPFQHEVVIAVNYKGQLVGQGRLDLLVNNSLVVELKAVQNLAPIHEAQVLSYLKITKHPLALLINFNVPVLKDGIRRIILPF